MRFFRVKGFLSLNHTSSSRYLTLVHPKLEKIVDRELAEEAVRDFLPPQPLVPAGWKLFHTNGSNRFDLMKECEVRQCGKEQLHVIAFMEQKQYEGTYRMDNGEREEQEYLNFTLFLKKLKHRGGLEIGLTSIDLEVVVDSLSIHKTDDLFYNAHDALGATSLCQTLVANNKRASMYRGPMLSELDDDLSDEVLDYLDERGVNNAFAEYMVSQAHYFEQSEYIGWLNLLKKFSRK